MSAINRSVKPFDNILVRRAVAHGLDRASVVRSFYAGRGVVAHEFMPPSVAGYSNSVPKYAYNPNRAKAATPASGSDASGRAGVLVAGRRVSAVHAEPEEQLPGIRREPEQVGIQGSREECAVEPDLPGSRRCRESLVRSTCSGWTGDYGDASSFLDSVLRSFAQFGLPEKYPLYRLLDRALMETDADVRNATYRQFNNESMRDLIGVPYVHTRPALAFTRGVVGYRPSPTTSESFASVRKTS